MFFLNHFIALFYVFYMHLFILNSFNHNSHRKISHIYHINDLLNSGKTPKISLNAGQK